MTGVENVGGKTQKMRKNLGVTKMQKSRFFPPSRNVPNDVVAEAAPVVGNVRLAEVELPPGSRKPRVQQCEDAAVGAVHLLGHFQLLVQKPVLFGAKDLGVHLLGFGHFHED